MNENKWWEFYIIRYSMGTMVGSVIVYALLKSNADLSQFLLLPKDNKLEYFHFIFLAFYGLTYCYISSAPILVWHASRFSFSFGSTKKIINPIWYMLALTLLSAYLVLSFIAPSIVFSQKTSLILLFLIVIVPQWALIFLTVIKADDNYNFYKKLSEKRESDKTDIRESYKHLREHGNSFGILFLEIIMGIALALIGYENINYLIGFVLLWILPAVLVWFIGTGLESKFANE